MKILIIGGFLGAGKTRFIQKMAQKLEREFVIVENEFSKIDVDAKTLRENKEMKIFELSEGCICCSLNLDFTQSLLTIKNTLNPDYLIVEPSGVATVSQIIAKLKNIVYEDIKIIPPITIVDAENYKTEKEDFSTYFYDQLESARHIIVSKSEKLREEDFRRMKEELEIKDTQNFYTKHYDRFTKEDFEKLLLEEIAFTDGGLEIKKVELKESEKLDNISFEMTSLKTLPQIIKLLEDVIRGRFGKIIRAKGYINLSGGAIKFDLVDKKYAITGAEENTTGFVFIGKNLDKKSLTHYVVEKNKMRKLKRS